MEQSDISCLAELDPTPSMNYVYLLRYLKTRKLYYGYTNDLNRRLEEHKKESAFELIYFEAYKAETDARRREKQLKNYAQALTALKQRLKESLT
jgi:predicted GIY-YIG superfamily endonuclease